MTMLASWIGVDTHGITSAYIASDSRITWGNNDVFDYCKKVFACKQFPEIFGYCGDVLFPSIILSQIVEMIDAEMLFDRDDSCDEKNKRIFEKIMYSLNKYPDELSDLVQILHISRETNVKPGVYPNFSGYFLQYKKEKGMTQEKLKIPDQSGLLYALGTGSTEFKKNYALYQEEANRNTSRNVFHCFIQTLAERKIPKVGGPPQLVGIYRKPLTNGRIYGIIYDGKRYLLGMQVSKESVFQNVEWRNELFELCDGATGRKLEGAARQPNPLR